LVILNVDGDGIRIDDPGGDVLISGMTISGAKGSGIVLGRSGASGPPNSVPLEEVLDLIESRLHELHHREGDGAPGYPTSAFC
jgi:hypothetical protein